MAARASWEYDNGQSVRNLADATGEAIAGSHEFGLTRSKRKPPLRSPHAYRWDSAGDREHEGLGNLFALMAQQPYLYATTTIRAPRSRQACAASNAAWRRIGSPDANRAIASQAQNLSG
jgi:hypothetical protein